MYQKNRHAVCLKEKKNVFCQRSVICFSKLLWLDCQLFKYELVKCTFTGVTLKDEEKTEYFKRTLLVTGRKIYLTFFLRGWGGGDKILSILNCNHEFIRRVDN